jgi:hypothetical protein
MILFLTCREQKEKQEAKDKYWKLHLQGKTDQAKADLGRLAKIRAEREEAQAKRKAEAEGMYSYILSLCSESVFRICVFIFLGGEFFGLFADQIHMISSQSR